MKKRYRIHAKHGHRFTNMVLEGTVKGDTYSPFFVVRANEYYPIGYKFELYGSDIEEVREPTTPFEKSLYDYLNRELNG